MKFNNCSKSLRQKIDMIFIITVVIFVTMIYCIRISNCKPTQRSTRPQPSYHNNIYRRQSGPLMISASSNASPRSKNLLAAGSETNQQAFVVVDNDNHNNYQQYKSTIESMRDTDFVTEVNADDEINDNKNNSRYESVSEDAASQNTDDKYQISEEIVYIDPKTGLQVEEPSAEQLKKFGGKIPEVVVEHVVQDGETNEEFVEYLEQPNQSQIDSKYNNEYLQQQQQQYTSNAQADKQQIYTSLSEQPVGNQYQMNIPLAAGLDLTVPATILTEIAASFLPTEVLKQLRDDYGVRVVATREQKDAKLTINCEDATINTSVCEKLKRKTPPRTQTNQQQSYEYNQQQQQQQQQQQYRSQENQPSRSAGNVENQTASVEFSNLDNASIEPILLHDVARIDPNTLRPYNIGSVNESSDAYDNNSTATIQGTYNQGYGNAERIEEVTTIKYPSEQQAIPTIQSHQQHYDLVPDSLQQDASAESKRQQLKTSDVIMAVNSTDVGNSSLNFNNNNNQTANSTTIPSSEQTATTTTTRQVLMYLPTNGQHQLINTVQQVKQDSITSTSGKISSNDELQTDSSDKKDIKIVAERSSSNVVSKQTTKV